MWIYLKRLRTRLIMPLVLLALAFASITTSFAANIPVIYTFAPGGGSVQGGTAIIDVMTPPHAAGTVTVKVTNPSGASATAPQAFLYTTP